MNSSKLLVFNTWGGAPDKTYANAPRRSMHPDRIFPSLLHIAKLLLQFFDDRVMSHPALQTSDNFFTDGESVR